MNEQQIQQAAIMQRRYEERIARQSGRIGTLIEFLTERGLLEEFNAWEAVKRSNEEANV
jgi:hypothetical protein